LDTNNTDRVVDVEFRHLPTLAPIALGVSGLLLKDKELDTMKSLASPLVLHGVVGAGPIVRLEN
jgi:hypothetical protein